MAEFTIHTLDSAPADAKQTLTAAKDTFGFVPNLLGELANAPAAAKAYVTLHGLLSETSFSPVEQNLVLITVSRENECHYCVAAHTAGLKQAGLADDQIAAAREGRTLDDEKLEALKRFTAAVVRERGHVADETVTAFLDAGYEKPQVFEVLIGVAMKTLGNYTNHIAETPLDEQLRPFAWEPAGAAR